MTSYMEWLGIQNGTKASTSLRYDPTRRYIRNGRDLAEWVHQDWPYNGFLNALLILQGMKVNVDAGNPYWGSTTQLGFVTFGPVMYFDLVARVAVEALKATWYQKWSVHRCVRPEAFAGTVHNTLTGAASYPVSSKLLDSAAVSRVYSQYRTYLLPMAYPEGSPIHSSYPAGHASIAGACVTILKALFDESFVIPNPVVASEDGLSLLSYEGPPLTVGRELNKLASNISLGRDVAGVHWRSDGIQGVVLGEAVALKVLADLRTTYPERFNGFSLTRFDGTMVTV